MAVFYRLLLTVDVWDPKHQTNCGRVLRPDLGKPHKKDC